VGRALHPLTEVTDTALAVAGEVSVGETGEGSTSAQAGRVPDGAGGGLGRRVPEGAPGTEVGRLAEAFNTMLTAVQTEVAGRQESEQRMRQFLADASHELRTPLTSLRGYAELITMRERRDGVQREPESADALRRITDEGARMSRLVNDLLVLARRDDDESGVDGGPPRARVALDELAVDAVADLRASHPTRRITLEAAPSSVVLGDPDQLRQVLANLLTNAAVHTGGDIRVAVHPIDGQVLIAVADDGPGLSAPQAAHAFDRFWRADKARTRVKGGSGLGLSIVDALVSAHCGAIDFDTAPAAGTTVTVRIPAAHP
jgi:two-component system OmpR family sensor kinase